MVQPLKYASVLLFVLMPVLLFAQRKEQVTIEQAKVMKYVKRGNEELRKLIGDVRLRQGEMVMTADSVLQNARTGKIDAYGGVHIQQGDSIDMWGETLNYNSNTRLAVLNENVVLEDKEMRLRTEQLYYNLGSNIGYYNDSAHITTEEIVLTSRKGYYHGENENLYFRHEVKLVHPQFTLYSDTLRYVMPTEVAYFYGPTRILGDDNLIYTEDGWHNTKTGKAKFGKNAYMQSGSQWLYGDSLYYDRNRGYGRAIGNIRVVDTLENYTITGGEGEHWEETEVSRITDSVLLVRPMDRDTFHLHADVLEAQVEVDTADTTQRHRLILAYHNSRSWSREFQTLADSLVYSFRDSTIYLYQEPALFFDDFQATADSIRIRTTGNQVKRIEMAVNSFIISDVDTIRFNQIKGKNMVAHFRNSDMYRIDVHGNGEAVYFLIDDDRRFLGVNKVASSDIAIRLDSNEIKDITFYKLPAGAMNPVTPVANPELKLKDFKWLGELRPQSVEDLFKELDKKATEPKKSVNDRVAPGRRGKQEEPEQEPELTGEESAKNP